MTFLNFPNQPWWLWMVSAAALVIVMLLCVLGTFAPRRYYYANFLQVVGFWGVFVFTWPRLMLLFQDQAITSHMIPAFNQLFGHVGLALYGLGTAWRAYKIRNLTNDWSEASDLQPRSRQG